MGAADAPVAAAVVGARCRRCSRRDGGNSNSRSCPNSRSFPSCPSCPPGRSRRSPGSARRTPPTCAASPASYADLLPKGLYARALIIIIAPIVVLEGVVAFVFMERHWQAVTRRLSEATARDIAALIDVYEEYPRKDDYSQLIEMARDRLNLSMQILPPGDLPAAAAQALLRPARPGAFRRGPPPGAAPVLDRHGRPVAPRGDPRQARQRHPALRRDPLADVRLQLAHLPACG